ncbi:hypothetical protein GCM10028803_04930 [Larkinella knui]|uniref:Uncharacterized protein n=1 Tax=Larkinella knui TaxID=2025310 RepID=A0A3P1CKP5_9BACT|nr:hypothetical protein [Larkinella knui]RRB13829.1 hypothetical protein EHT87_16350 [Larkinella knui]
MNTLLTTEIKEIILSGLFVNQTVEFNESKSSFSVKQQSGFVHSDQFLPLFKTDVRAEMNTVSIDENGLDAHFFLYRDFI